VVACLLAPAVRPRASPRSPDMKVGWASRGRRKKSRLVREKKTRSTVESDGPARFVVCCLIVRGRPAKINSFLRAGWRAREPIRRFGKLLTPIKNILKVCHKAKRISLNQSFPACPASSSRLRERYLLHWVNVLASWKGSADQLPAAVRLSLLIELRI
jgi:hypothetical protein